MIRIGEKVSVLASFTGSIRPIKFKWSGKLVTVQEVTYTWKSREGQASVHHFSVTDGTSLYELSFHSQSLIWRLENLEA
ncbi:MAG: hypothetical protein AB7Y74_07700 [Syntrophorhabdus sp.]|jgi:hypothetical protein